MHPDVNRQQTRALRDFGQTACSESSLGGLLDQQPSVRSLVLDQHDSRIKQILLPAYRPA
jgi:hypothetical protein